MRADDSVFRLPPMKPWRLFVLLVLLSVTVLLLLCHNQLAISREMTLARDTTSVLLEHQIRLQSEFQQLIHRNQHPSSTCRKRRILFTWKDEPVRDGFTVEMQYMARHLQTALATDRTLVVRDNFQSAYAPESCTWSKRTEAITYRNSWECLYEPLSNCTEPMAKKKKKALNHVNAASTLSTSAGIVDNDESPLFNTRYFGSRRIAETPSIYGEDDHIDVIDYWDRTMGRFWVRAQTAHYLWRPSKALQSEMKRRLPKDKFFEKPFIGIHVRFSDNIENLLNDFGRDAYVTRGVGKVLEVANEIRRETGINTIYLATDSQNFLESLSKLPDDKDWHVYVQGQVQRTTEEDWMWFADTRHIAAPAVATDVEVLRRADYLIGSYQSNVYRLATELNTAYHVAKYPLHMNRHRALDVLWYEDP